MNNKGFQNILAWQESFQLTKNIYNTLTNCRDFSFRDQIQRASVSVMNNIAEGSARKSDKAFYSFLSIAKGSCAEVESMLLLGKELNYISEEEFGVCSEKCDKAARLISGLMKKLKAQDS